MSFQLLIEFLLLKEIKNLSNFETTGQDSNLGKFD